MGAGCNPIGAGNDCLLPYPSDVFLTDGRVVIPPEAEVTFAGFPADMVALHRPDGFSVGSPILALFPQGIDDSNLVFWKGDVARSREPSSPTVLIDANTGERILHFAEVDPRASTDDRRALIIRPQVRLENGHRYVVAIHDLFDKAGHYIDPPAGFRSLRDDEGRGHPRLEALSQHFEESVFPVLAAAGVSRNTLQLAWDFTTTTEKDATGDMLDIRADLLSKLDASPPEIEIVSTETDPTDHIATRIEATVTVPQYVDTVDPGGTLVYGNDGKVTAQGTTKVPFTILIPKSVANRAPGSPPARLMQFGHGFFGSRKEASDFPSQLADEKGFVIVAADWWGLAKADQAFVANQIFLDPSRVPIFVDRLQQAMANLISVAAAAKGSLADLPELQIQGERAYDPSTLYYYGISMGGILGSVYVTLSPYVDRAALSVCGADWSLMLFRSQAFLPFLALIATKMPDPLDQQKLGALLQSTLERVDPMTYAPHMLGSRYPGNPPTLDIVTQIGIGDLAVPNVASFYQARILGMPVLQPSPFAPFGVVAAESPASGSAMTIFDFGVVPDDLAEAGFSDNAVHDDVRKTEGSKNQIDLFFRPGAPVTQTCDGVCDPE